MLTDRIIIWPCICLFFLIAEKLFSCYVINGKNAKIEDYPFMVQIYGRDIDSRNVTFMGGGTIIAHRWILTASHLFEEFEGPFHILAGRKEREQGTRFAVVEVIRHHKFSNVTMVNDIALMRLAEPIQYSETMNKIEIAPKNGKYGSPKDAKVLGWGGTWIKDQRNYANELQVAAVLVHPEAECSTFSALYKSDIMLCAIDQLAKKDSERGDSGGPLINTVNETYRVQIGVVSFAQGMADANFSLMAYYTRISPYANWIKKTIAKYE